MWDLWNFSFLDVSQTHSELSLCVGFIGKTPGLISLNNLVKKMSASAVAILSWQV